MNEKKRPFQFNVKFSRNRLPRVLNARLVYDGEKCAYYIKSKPFIASRNEFNDFLDFYEISKYITFEFDKSNSRYYLKSQVSQYDDRYAYSVWYNLSKYFKKFVSETSGSIMKISQHTKVINSVKIIARYVMSDFQKDLDYEDNDIKTISCRSYP